MPDRILTEVECFVNRVRAGFPWMLLALGIIACNLSASPDYWVSPWRLARSIRPTTAVDGVSLWESTNRSNAESLLIWPGDPSMPNLRLWNFNADPTPLPLGIRPGQVTLYPLAGGNYQVLWLDQTLPGQSQLVGGTFGADHEVTRGPTEIARHPVIEYYAVPTPGGDLIAVWSEAGTPLTPIYATLIDSIGRPREPILLARNGRHPSAVFAPGGDLHIGWLEPGSIWTVNDLVLPGGTLRTGLSPASVGVFKLDASQSVDDFLLGADTQRIYCLWKITTVTSTAISSQLSGLSFAFGDSKQSKSIDLRLPLFGNLSLRALTLARGNSATGGLIAAVSVYSAETLERPLILTITENGITSTQFVTRGIPGDGPIRQLSLSLRADGLLTLSWSVIQADGSSVIYVATNAP